MPSSSEKSCLIEVDLNEKRVKKVVPEWYVDSEDFQDRKGTFINYVEN
jgi:hypothetical protein